MSKLVFSPDDLRKGFAIAKIVKPMSGDFALKVSNGRLVIFSFDRRRQVRAEVAPQSSDAPDGFSTEDYYVPADRSSLFESDLERTTLTFTDKGLSVRSDGGGQTRQASFKKRSDSARRTPIPDRVMYGGSELPAREFEELLRQVSCSALVKETKTDEDMKVNQVHFYPEQSCAMANARFYASVATLPGLSLELSIVSADIPMMKSFCGRVDGNVILAQDKTKLHLGDVDGGTTISFSRVASTRPPLTLLSEDGYEVEVSVRQEQLKKCLSWSSLAIEGTQRVTIRTRSDSGSYQLDVLNGHQELASIPAAVIRGSEFRADFPVRVLAAIVGYLGDGNAVLKYRHRDLATILEIAEESSDGTVKARHFVTSMKERA